MFKNYYDSAETNEVFNFVGFNDLLGFTLFYKGLFL